MPIHVQNLTIETPRLILRQPTIDDVDAIQKAKMDTWDQLKQWMSWTAEGQDSVGATRDFILKYQQKTEDGSLVFCGFRRDTGAYVISSGLHLNPVNPDYLEIGYWVVNDQQGHGFASETCNALIRVAFNYFAVPAVTIDHFEGNDRSRNVIQKMGFEFSHVQKDRYIQHSTGQKIDAPYYVLKDISALPPLDYRIV
jgi:RimJ/RimL family protein N-acetyltransferase